jgi:sarcosine oxidase
MTPYDCVLVGAGIHGLCTAFWLRRAGLQRLCVLEQHQPGHTLGSSHGATRITRCLYQEPELVDLARRANDDAWPTLESALGMPLRLPTPGVFFGLGNGPMAGYLAATEPHRDRTEVLTAAAAAKRFPQLRFAPDHIALVDRTAAVVLAARTMQRLREWLQAHGVELRWQTRALALQQHHEPVTVTTDRGELSAERVVLAAGPWLSRLQPTGDAAVLPQQIGYFDTDALPADCRPGVFPVWAKIGSDPNDFVYGLPDLDGQGLKAARHVTAGAGIAPDAEPAPIDRAALLALGRSHFTAAVRGLRATERCLYTMARDQRLEVRADPGAPVVTIAACSGHAFKFGPEIGRRAAELALAAR